MKKIIYTEKKENIRMISEHIKKGDIVAIPTDTIYGFSTNPFNFEKVKLIWKIKERPFSKKMILLAGSIEIVQRYVTIILSAEIKKLWPGPNSVVLPVNDILPEYLKQDGKVAFRIPDNKFLKELLLACNIPIISTSINRSNEPHINKVDVIEREFSEYIDVLVVIPDWIAARNPSHLFLYDNKNLKKIR